MDDVWTELGRASHSNRYRGRRAWAYWAPWVLPCLPANRSRRPGRHGNPRLPPTSSVDGTRTRCWRRAGFVASYKTKEDLSAAFRAFIASNADEAYVLYRELDYFEQLAALEHVGVFDFELIRLLLGRTLIDRWEMWQPSMEGMVGMGGYPMFDALVAKMKIALASTGGGPGTARCRGQTQARLGCRAICVLCCPASRGTTGEGAPEDVAHECLHQVKSEADSDQGHRGGGEPTTF